MLEVNELSKKFDKQPVVDKLSFRVRPGEIFGLLGPNGAGKTTSIRMLMNILRPDSGEITYNEKPRHKVERRLFGYLPEERGLYQRATVLEMLIYFGTLNKLTRHRAEVEAIRMLDRLRLVDYTQRRVNELSKGMQQKIQFITAVMHDPEVLILDEPFSGLDPVNQIVLREIIAQYRKEGKIIILSTHQMDEVERLSDHICLINQGRAILDGRITDIKKKFREDAYFIESEEDISFIREIRNIEILEMESRSCKIALKKSNGNIRGLLDEVASKATLKKFIQVEPTLHDIFIKLIQTDHPEE
jgi:ABC-2 type transport system ATP-binding protein